MDRRKGETQLRRTALVLHYLEMVSRLSTLRFSGLICGELCKSTSSEVDMFQQGRDNSSLSHYHLHVFVAVVIHDRVQQSFAAVRTPPGSIYDSGDYLLCCRCSWLSAGCLRLGSLCSPALILASTLD